MTEPSSPSHVIPFWPVWTRTLDAMIRGLTSVRSRCRHCGSLLRLNLGTLRARLGGFASLIDRTGPCPVVGCTGTVYYLGAPATGAAYHVLIGDLALFHGVADPTATPFRSRWHGMATIGPASFPVLAEVVPSPGALSGKESCRERPARLAGPAGTQIGDVAPPHADRRSGGRRCDRGRFLHDTGGPPMIVPLLTLETLR